MRLLSLHTHGQQASTKRDMNVTVSTERQLMLHKKSPGSTSSLSTAMRAEPRHQKNGIASIKAFAIRAMPFFFVPVLAFRDGKNGRN